MSEANGLYHWDPRHSDHRSYTAEYGDRNWVGSSQTGEPTPVDFRGQDWSVSEPEGEDHLNSSLPPDSGAATPAAPPNSLLSQFDVSSSPNKQAATSVSRVTQQMQNASISAGKRLDGDNPYLPPYNYYHPQFSECYVRPTHQPNPSAFKPITRPGMPFQGNQFSSHPVVIQVPVIVQQVPAQLGIGNDSVVAEVQVVGTGHVRLNREKNVIDTWLDYPQARISTKKTNYIQFVMWGTNPDTPFDYAHACCLNSKKTGVIVDFNHTLTFLGVMSQAPTRFNLGTSDAIKQIKSMSAKLLLANTKDALSRIIRDINTAKYQGRYQLLLAQNPLIRDESGYITNACGCYFFACIDPNTAIKASKLHSTERYQYALDAMTHICYLFCFCCVDHPEEAILIKMPLYKLSLSIYKAYHVNGENAEKFKTEWQKTLTSQVTDDQSKQTPYLKLGCAPLIETLGNELGEPFRVSDLLTALRIDLANTETKQQQAVQAELKAKYPIAAQKTLINKKALQTVITVIPELKLLFTLVPNQDQFYLFDILNFFHLLGLSEDAVSNLPIKFLDNEQLEFRLFVRDKAGINQAKQFRAQLLKDDIQFQRYDLSKILSEHSNHIHQLQELGITPKLLWDYFETAEENQPRKRILKGDTTVGAMWLDFELAHKSRSADCTSVYQRAFKDTLHIKPKQTKEPQDLWAFSLSRNGKVCRFKAIGIGMLGPSYYRYAEKTAEENSWKDFQKQAQGTCDICRNPYQRFRLNYDLTDENRKAERIPPKTWYHCDETGEDCCYDCAKKEAPIQNPSKLSDKGTMV
ncbi:hypothetical protein D5018_10580 [Parashewanella curva]|uniref:Uncharacterized protein n=1 Tax=Parashewanella curva TaxID=2338552 RepID=A0A3L8PY10_9GAMM|nr:hypothetical protein [Parashewanella curva]RLV59699.1 hypothetical protein D5018_10580 [Parashewanella curva]